MAKLGLPVGIEIDVTGLRKMGREASGELEKLRGATNRIGSSINAAMALPMIGFLSNVMSAHAEARKIQADLMAPFSQKMQQAQVSADVRKMEMGQRMVAAGMDETAARSITVQAEREMMTGLLAQQQGSTLGRSLESFITEPGQFMANIVRAVEGNVMAQSAGFKELMSGNIAGAFGFGERSEMGQAQFELGAARNAAALGLASNNTPAFESMRTQLERQTYILAEIERNSKGAR